MLLSFFTLIYSSDENKPPKESHQIFAASVQLKFPLKPNQTIQALQALVSVATTYAEAAREGKLPY